MAKNVREVGTTALDLAGRRYPSFAYGAALKEGSVTVFCFHSVERDPFERQLGFLSENNYVTLTADEYYAVIVGKSPAPRKAVVLTFDDGWGSLWSVGYPLLKKYGLRVVVFLAAGRIEHRTRYRPNLHDVATGEVPEGEVSERDESEQPLLTWEEIAEMHGSGLVDFQSHSYSHTLVYRSPRIVDFVRPELLEWYSFLEIPNPHLEWRPKTKVSVRLGEPLYEAAPRLSDARRFLPDPRISDACASLVEERGSDFFQHPKWRSTLLRVVREQTGESRCETDRERMEAVWFELAGSRHTIEEHLPGKEVRHLCYPWHEAGTLAVRLSREAGYLTNFFGKVDGRYYSRNRTDPFRIPRVSGDFLFRLPGKGRVGLIRTLAHKFGHRLQRGSPYLTH